MYTLDEINEEAKSKGWKAFWKIFLFFGIGFPILGLIILLLLAPNENIDKESITGFLLSMFPICFLAGLFGGAISSAFTSIGTKKKMKEENEQEERQERDEHYKRMEELLEKMSKNNNNNEKED